VIMKTIRLTLPDAAFADLENQARRESLSVEEVLRGLLSGRVFVLGVNATAKNWMHPLALSRRCVGRPKLRQKPVN